jgi:hypothetical protein
MFHSFQNVESSSHGHIWIILDPWTWLYRHIDAMAPFGAMAPALEIVFQT